MKSLPPLPAFLLGTFVIAGCQTTVSPDTSQTAGQVAPLTVSLAGSGWDGVTIPEGQECERDGGNGSTPPLRVSGIPAGTDTLVVEFNDLDYPPLSSNGGHGKIGYRVSPGATTATLAAVPGHSRAMPEGAFIVANNRGYKKIGYVPPCSNGAGHRYAAIVTALGDGQTLAKSPVVSIGRY